MKKVILLIAFTVVSFFAISQKNYEGALGLRFGWLQNNASAGITGKLFLKEKDALEGILNYGLGTGGWLSLTVLYERHATLFDVPELNAFYGAGGGISVFESGFNAGIDGIVGVEYTMAEIPINFSLDVKPYFNLLPFGDTFHFNSALSIRYTFK